MWNDLIRFIINEKLWATSITKFVFLTARAVPIRVKRSAWFKDSYASDMTLRDIRSRLLAGEL